METVNDKSSFAKRGQNKKGQKSGTAKIFAKPTNPTHLAGDESKPKLRTSKDVFNRLKWDASTLGIDTTDLYIGYKDRFLGMCEVKFTDFNPCAEYGDIPYHRIYYFRGGGAPISPLIGKDGEIAVREDNWPPEAIIYWDRETRLDLIFNSGQTFSNGTKAKYSKKNRLPPPNGYQTVPAYRYNAEKELWEIPDPELNHGTRIDRVMKVVTLNVLYDLYEDDFCRSDLRWPYLIDFLEESNADIIALQEVTPKFLRSLESSAWVRKSYFLTEISTVATTVTPSGQIFLSKYFPRETFFSEQFSKRFLISTFQVNTTVVLSMANIHLNSNYRGDNTKVRGKQMRQLLTALAELNSKNAAAEVIIVGDTNFSNKEELENSSSVKMVDVWEEVNAEDPGWTFNIHENSLAQHLSKTATFCRFDRIFRNQNCTFLKPVAIRVTGKAAIDFSKPSRAGNSNSPLPLHDLWISDHFALECEFELVDQVDGNENKTLQHRVRTGNVSFTEDQHSVTFDPSTSPRVLSPTFTSAVAIIPPANVWQKIQTIRSQFDPSYARWPPHINLIYGFIPDIDGNFEHAQEKFEQILKTFEEPMVIRLSKLGKFERNQSITVYVTVSDPEVQMLTVMQTRLESEYPKCKQSSAHSAFTPHLTLAKLPHGTAEEKKIADDLIESWKQFLLKEPVQFTVEEISLMSRKFNEPFRVKKSIQIGVKEDRKISVSPLQDFLVKNNLVPSAARFAAEPQVVTEVHKLCSKVLPEFSVHLVGSSQMGFQDDYSDIDLLICGPLHISHQSFFESLEKQNLESLGNVLQLKSIVLDTLVPIARLKFHEIEIDLVYCPCGANNWKYWKDDELMAQSEAFIRSIDGIREADALKALIPAQLQSTYGTCVRALKYWAKRRNIYCQVMGFLSGNTIALLVGKVLLTHLDPSKMTPEELLAGFFEFYYAWKWPLPVTLTSSVPKPLIFNRAAPDIMPICAPSFPYLSRTRNVTKSTRALIQKEISRANEIFAEIGPNFEAKWSLACEKEDFFGKYPLYLEVRVSCIADAGLSDAEGILRSRIVHLVVQIQKHLKIYCQPHTQIFRREHDASAFLGLEAVGVLKKDLNEVIASFKSKLEKWIESYVRDRVEIQIHEIKCDSSELEKFRKLECPEVAASLENSNDRETNQSATSTFSISTYGVVSLVAFVCLTLLTLKRHFK